jgi:glucosylceramidase
LDVDAQQRFQVMDGFGASLTDSSAWLLHDQLSASARREVMRKLFDPEKGIGISFLRQPLGASELARNRYSYDDMPAGERDPELLHFSIQHDEAYILPVVRDALKLNPSISVMVTPWSPPGWMKTRDSMIGGQLRDDAFAEYANYLVKSVEGYQKAGVPVKFLSVQNEPLLRNKGLSGDADACQPAEEVYRRVSWTGPFIKRESIRRFLRMTTTGTTPNIRWK